MSLREIAGLRLSRQVKRPVMWQARMRNSTMTGVLLASDSSKPFSIISTMVVWLGRGSISQMADFMA